MISKKLLEKYVTENGEIKIAIAGAGYISLGLINQIVLCKGIKVVGISSKTKSKAEYLAAKLPYTIEIFDDVVLLTETDADIIIDLTGDVEIGSQLGVAAIQNNKHFVASAESDATVGPVLAKMARTKGLIYSNMWGDEPGLIKGLYDYADILGFEIIAIGKFKGFHNPYATPESVKPWAEKSLQNPTVISSFADGSKMSLEMTVVSNATGFVPDKRGMHLPKGNLDEIATLLKLKEEGGILSKKGVIEVILGAQPSGGVYALIRTDNPEIIASMSYYKQGDGPNYLLYIPYHMPGIEMVYGIIEMMILKKAIVEPMGKPVSDVMAFAKKDLFVGDILGKIGGFEYYGEIEVATVARNIKALPLGLAKDAVMLKDVKKGDIITEDCVDIKNHPITIELRKEFDKLLLE